MTPGPGERPAGHNKKGRKRPEQGDGVSSIESPDKASASATVQTWSASPIRQWWLVGSVAILMMLSSIDRNVMSLLIQSIKTDLQLTDTEVSLLMGISYALVHTVIIIPSGWAADRWLRRGIIGAGAVSWSIMTTLCGFATSYWQLFAARAGVGLTEGTIEPASYSIVRDGLAPNRRGRAFGIMGMASLVGMGLAMITGGLLLGVFTAAPITLPILGELAPWQCVLVAVGLAGLPLSGLMLTVTEPGRAKSAQLKSAEPGFRETWTHLRGNWTLYLPILVFALAHGLISASFGAWLPAFLMRVYDFTPMQVGFTFGTAIIIAAPIGAFLAGVVIDWANSSGRAAGLPLVGIVGTLLIGIPAIFAPLAPTPTIFWSMFGVQLLMSAVPFPVIATAIARATPSRLMGKVISLRIFIGGIIVSTVAPTLVAVIGDTLYGGDAGGPRAIGYAISTVSAMAMAVALLACAAIWVDYVKRQHLDE
jgi:MFS transporter, Spinster family, sphingosine-1-phosphate transporter